MYRAFLQVYVDADSLIDAYNRIEILMMRWPNGRWRYVDPASTDLINLDHEGPHAAPEDDRPHQAR